MESFWKERVSECITLSMTKEDTRDTRSGISEEVLQNIAVSIANQNEEFALLRELKEKNSAEQEKELSKKKQNERCPLSGPQYDPKCLSFKQKTAIILGRKKGNCPSCWKTIINWMTFWVSKIPANPIV